MSGGLIDQRVPGEEAIIPRDTLVIVCHRGSVSPYSLQSILAKVSACRNGAKSDAVDSHRVLSLDSDMP